ncbi:carboxypeptidase-like regulatory domain-containing protein [Jiulongibacter sediminis]|jgi:outer membrane receptor protein involved in Fe transport|uniref:carboxypeptidase-like regulatory domain-containing protein n=1 Tax=Jiulongibacter sediminis TaxID=1605367 RepID=UPI0026EE515E|nr:carboxypeptidase-like regulatory domain-containing protein [Jiulongibacter sediminis]
MNKPKLKKLVPLIILLFGVSSLSYAQTRISGTITDAGTKEPLIGVSVQVKNKIIGTITDIKGQFELNTSTPLPFELVISSIGYQTQEVQITADNSDITISLEEQAIQGQEVVVAASRVEESVLKSPVTVEKLDIRGIQQSASTNFYESLGNMKGIDLTTQGLLFRSVNMRGFGATGNPRTVQMIDGMDNSAPGLNFPMDNIIGIPELDLESVEVLPGASSALYGPNAINGLILMTSKSPFLYQGLSANVKTGLMSASNRDVTTTPFYDASIRYAKAFNNKFAFKANLSYIEAYDWQATDYTNLNAASGNPHETDAMNIYGDEVQANLQTVANGLLASSLVPNDLKAQLQGALDAGLVPNMNVSRTGFIERDVVDYNTKSFKANLAMHYRLNEKIEAIGQYNFGYGTTVYTGTGRYSLRDFNLSQYKLELRGDNFTLRGYTTQERSGKSYTAGLAAVAMLNNVSPHELWFGEYLQAYLTGRLSGADANTAHGAARAYSDRNLPQAGTAEFETLLNTYRDKAIVDGGGGFLEKTNMYHAEGVYNFKNEISFMDLLVGANVRQYQLRSNGTLFADTKDGRDGTISINEYGGFIQAAKSVFGDHLKLTGSVRYDKNENFDGQFSPRLSAVTSFGSSNIRLSYQQGFRIPTTQNQYIDLRTPAGTLIGGLPEFNNRYNLSNGIAVATLNAFSADIAKNGANSSYITEAVKAKATAYATAAVTPSIPVIQNAVIAAVLEQVTAAVTAGVQAAVAAGQIPPEQAPAAIAAQVQAQMASQDVQAGIAAQVTKVVTEKVTEVATQVIPAYALEALPKYQYKRLQPERIVSYEIGYKGVLGKKLLVDTYYYFSKYSNFIGGTSIVVPTTAAGPGLPIESGVGSANTRLGYSRPANTDQDITVSGWAAQLDYSLPKGFNIGANIANNVLKGFTPTAEQQYAGFNSPKYRYNLSFGKRIGSGDKFGFNVNLRHQDEFVWQSSFVLPTNTSLAAFQNTMVPAVNNLDAQVSFKLHSIKSIIKIGGTNIGGKPYIQAFGSPAIGSMYYAAITFDELLNK